MNRSFATWQGAQRALEAENCTSCPQVCYQIDVVLDGSAHLNVSNVPQGGSRSPPEIPEATGWYWESSVGVFLMVLSGCLSRQMLFQDSPGRPWESSAGVPAGPREAQKGPDSPSEPHSNPERFKEKRRDPERPREARRGPPNRP